MADLLSLLQNDNSVRDAARLTVSRMPRLVIARAATDGSLSFQNVSRAFTTIEVNSVMIDNFNAFDASTFTWVVPETGTYEVNGKMRLADGNMAGLSYGIGLDVSNVDNAGFFWGSGNNNRQGIFNSRIIMLTQGQRLRLYAYCDTTSAGVTAAELNAVRIA